MCNTKPDQCIKVKTSYDVAGWGHAFRGFIEVLTFALGAKLIYKSYFASLLHPQEEKLGYYFQLGTCLGALETHVLLSFLWSAFCKPVINVTLLTLKKVVLKIQD